MKKKYTNNEMIVFKAQFTKLQQKKIAQQDIYNLLTVFLKDERRKIKKE